MTDIQEIRERHKKEPHDPTNDVIGYRAHQDRGTLLAYIETLEQAGDELKRELYHQEKSSEAKTCLVVSAVEQKGGDPEGLTFVGLLTELCQAAINTAQERRGTNDGKE